MVKWGNLKFKVEKAADSVLDLVLDLAKGVEDREVLLRYCLLSMFNLCTYIHLHVHVLFMYLLTCRCVFNSSQRQ